MDVGQIRRVVLIDETGNSAIISEPAWDAWSPHLTADRIVFTQITAFDPNNQDTNSNLNDVYLYDRSEKISVSLTSGSEAFTKIQELFLSVPYGLSLMKMGTLYSKYTI